MAHIFSISNQKGGVGKTTTAVNLAAGLAAAEYSTLLIDLDPQGNACSGLGIQKNQFENNIYHALVSDIPLSEVVLPTSLNFLKIIPSNSDLVAADLELVGRISRESRLKKIIEPISNQYDFIIIDCPPSLNLLTINALTAVNSVIVPVQCEYYALEGLSELLKTVKMIKDNLNSSLEIEGILLTMFDPRNNLSHQVAEEIKKYFPDKVFRSVIPRNVKLSESPSHGKPVLLYDIYSKGSIAYLDFTKEVLNKAFGIHSVIEATKENIIASQAVMAS